MKKTRLNDYLNKALIKNLQIFKGDTTMYSPKIKEDLIPIIYEQSKLRAKTMTEFVDELLRPLLLGKDDYMELDYEENCQGVKEEGQRDDDKYDDEVKFCCRSCRMQVERTQGDRGYCETCENEVFVEKY